MNHLALPIKAGTRQPLTLSPPIEPAPTLLTAPIELAGDWGRMLEGAAESGRRAHAACMPRRRPPRLRPSADTAPRRPAHIGVAGDLAAPRRQQHGLDHRRYRRAGLVEARLPVWP